ncbi:MAG: DUF3592 domain-containing protein [Bdellovibrionaceae bacterium]|nr:DUF3592 domain-containing protein [Pseudobdellovibrionaceae bacterium]
MEIILLFAGLVLIFLGALLITSELKARRGAIPVPGQIVGYTSSPGQRKQPMYRAVVKFRGPDYQTRYVESAVGSSSPLGQIGDEKTVLVQKTRPTEAKVRSPLTFVIGGALAAFGCVALFIFATTFKANAFSALVGLAVIFSLFMKIRGLLRTTPISREAWEEIKRKMMRARVYSETEAHEIPWVELEAIKKTLHTQEKAVRISRWIMAPLAIGSLAFGWHLFHDTQNFLSRAQRTDGQVIEWARNDSGESVTYTPVVRFQRPGQLESETFRHSVSSTHPSYDIGQTVPVLYDPTDQGKPRIDSGPWLLALPIGLGGLGAFFCLALVHSYFHLARRRRTGSPHASHTQFPRRSA